MESKHNFCEFKHNFCESKLNNENPPELWNAYTSIIISVFPFIFGFPEYHSFYSVGLMFAFNGLASFHYHYCLDWFGKQADEISMILANYFGLCGLIRLYWNDSRKRNRINEINTTFMYFFLVINTFQHLDFIFPHLFGVYVCGTIYMIILNSEKFEITVRNELLISAFGALSWVISENFCNEMTKFGHPIWHICFPLGFYRLLLKFDELKKRDLL